MFGRDSDRRAAWLTAIAAAVISFLFFSPSLDNGFIGWDDAENFIENRNFRGLGWSNIKWMFTSFTMGPYTPLTNLSLGLDYTLYGMNPVGYHFTAVLLHALNALLVCLLARRLLLAAVSPLPPGRESAVWQTALVTALFFALHPLRAESVCWLSDRHDLLAGFFYLLALNLYLAAPKPAAEPYWRRHWPALAAFLLSLLAKGMTVTLPLALLLLDIYPLRRLPARPAAWLKPEHRGVLLEKAPYFLLSGIFGVIGALCQAKVGALATLEQQGFGSRLGHALYSAFFYLRKTLFPVGLSPIYRLPEGFSLLHLQAIGSGLMLVLVTLAAFTRWPAVAAAWLYYLVTLAPVSGLMKFSAVAADRYSYLPGLGFAAIAGVLYWEYSDSERPARRHDAKVFAVLALFILAALSWKQQRVWDNSEALWSHALEVNPDLDTAHNNLGMALAARGEVREAVRHYQEALRLNPAMPTARANLGVALAAAGDYAGAVPHYLEAVRLDPACYKAHNNLCGALPMLGRAQEAIAHCEAALRLKPDTMGLNNNLGIALASLGRPAEALESYKRELALNPDFAEAWYNMAHELTALGRADEAFESYRQAVRLNPRMAKAHYNMGVLAGALGRPDEAAAHYRDAIAADPALGPAYNNLAILFNQRGRYEEALAQYDAALSVNPAYAEAWYNKALDLARLGRNAEAARCLARARQLNPKIGMR